MESAEKKNATRWNYSDSGIDNFLRHFFRPDLVEAFFLQNAQEIPKLHQVKPVFVHEKNPLLKPGIYYCDRVFCSFLKRDMEKNNEHPKRNWWHLTWNRGISACCEVRQL